MMLIVGILVDSRVGPYSGRWSARISELLVIGTLFTIWKMWNVGYLACFAL
jgi:hypothetical protein